MGKLEEMYEFGKCGDTFGVIRKTMEPVVVEDEKHVTVKVPCDMAEAPFCPFCGERL